MLNKDAILQLQQAESITAASAAIDSGMGTSKGNSLAPLPSDFNIHDLEQFMPNRRRARGSMTTRVLADFAAYIAAHKEDGAATFIDVGGMKATAVLNLGTPAKPGHADNKAVLQLQQTAAYAALRAIAKGLPVSQTAVAEFLEDWGTAIKCSHDGATLENNKAIQAVRDITIESLRKLGNTEAQLSATRTAFESVQAKGAEQIPTLIEFICEPYLGLKFRNFAMRLAILTTGDKPTITLRIVKDEEHQEQMGEEFAGLIRGAVKDVPVAIGSYAAS
jgi:uncharacterized protein YfdQ (DUF2303 family)